MPELSPISSTESDARRVSTDRLIEKLREEVSPEGRVQKALLTYLAEQGLQDKLEKTGDQIFLMGEKSPGKGLKLAAGRVVLEIPNEAGFKNVVYVVETAADGGQSLVSTDGTKFTQALAEFTPVEEDSPSVLLPRDHMDIRVHTKVILYKVKKGLVS